MIFTIFSGFLFALCGPWSQNDELLSLEAKSLKESSGILQYEDALYHINDSGDGPYIYRSHLDGSDVERIFVKGVDFIDQEALALTNCGDEKCLVVGDIGDNFRIRDQIDFYFIRIPNKNAKLVTPYHHLKVKYPDKMRNAEAFSFDHEGNLILVSKEGYKNPKRSENAVVYRLDKSDLFRSSLQTFNKIKQLSIKQWLPSDDHNAHLVTDMTIVDNRWLILTYDAILIIDYKSDGIQVCRTLRFERSDFPQAEAITYSNQRLYLTVKSVGFLINLKWLFGPI